MPPVCEKMGDEVRPARSGNICEFFLVHEEGGTDTVERGGVVAVKRQQGGCVWGDGAGCCGTSWAEGGES